MTDTELIATRLMGWTRHTNWPKEQGIRFDRPGFIPAVFEVEEEMLYRRQPGWPYLDDWNDIRRMEDALAERGLWDLYITYLWVVMTGSLAVPLYGWDLHSTSVTRRATQSQCVAAAVKVLREVEG